MLNDNYIDIELIKNLLLGDKNSENLFYEKYSKFVKLFIISKYSDYHDIDDDVSEIMIKVFLKLNQYDESKSKFSTWVCALTKNHIIDKWRRNGINYISNSNNIQYNSISSYSPDAFETTNMVDHLFTQVTSTDYDFLNMKYVEGYNYEEIGKRFNVTSSTVSNRVNYIKTKLKKNNKEIFYE